MTIEEQIFERHTLDFSKLEPYGFKKSNDTYVFEKTIMDGAFKAVVSVSKDGIKGDVYDVDTGDVYFAIRVDEMAIGYAGLVRTEYVNILKDICLKCTTSNVFLSAQTGRIASKLEQIYGDSPIFPWEKYPTFGIFKNPDSEKWYALVMSLEFEKLDAKKSGKIEVMNLKIDDQKIPELIKQNGIYPAYHMNKKYWITVVLNDSLDDETVLSLIDESHSFTLRKKKTVKK
ncbi:MAG TPA: MmcQ family protein [Alphaproteobacteria bacterium]|nr:MmcQ family protein [Alphaproteobacteria bacterium]